MLLHPDIGYWGRQEERRRAMDIAQRYTESKMPAIRTALANAGVQAAAQAGSARTAPGETSR